MDNPEWFTNPEHAHIVGLDADLARDLSVWFSIIDLEVDCGVEGEKSYTYHFRIRNVPQNQHGFVLSRARDLLSAWTPYRFEVQCVISDC